MTAGQNPKPPRGLRVLDVATPIAGPCSAILLGEFGAQVIEIAQPGVGDVMRQIGPRHVGADNRELYVDLLGMSATELQTLRDESVI